MRRTRSPSQCQLPLSRTLNPLSPSTCYPISLISPHSASGCLAWPVSLLNSAVRLRKRGAQSPVSLVRDTTAHTPSTAFRHPPPRKDVVNQCLEFDYSSVSSGDWASVSVGNSVSKVSDSPTSCCVSTLEWCQSSVFRICHSGVTKFSIYFLVLLQDPRATDITAPTPPPTHHGTAHTRDLFRVDHYALVWPQVFFTYADIPLPPSFEDNLTVVVSLADSCLCVGQT